LPTFEEASLYTSKAGSEILGQMFTFDDKKGRKLTLRPEGTATIQMLANQLPKNTKLFYITDCYRYERPQKGRYRQFTQIGVEIINPTQDYKENLIDLGKIIVDEFITEYKINDSTKRGLAYYSQGIGFEFTTDSLGSQKQILGGGAYKEGIGFAIGLDRLLLAKENIN
jgi:histidyl-tRNA synthetase